MAAATVSAQEVEKTVCVDSIVVTATPSLREIGTQKSTLEAAVLHESVTSSLAEVLSLNSTIFIKSSGRSSLSTASMRGNAPSHTQVSWNGIALSNPMLGMTDFSMIPSCLIDRSTVYYGASSVGVTGGGLGGAVELSSAAADNGGFGLRLIQNVASSDTYDEFVQLRLGSGRLQSSTRLYVTSSDNDFEYVNRDKIGHPVERNKNCGWRDKHVLQELYYTTRQGSRFSAAVWGVESSRGIPHLTVDYRSDNQTRSWQDEKSLRGVLGWARAWGGVRAAANAGYAQSDMRYTYRFSNGGTTMITAVDSHNQTLSLFGHADLQWNIGEELLLQLSADIRRHEVVSHDEASMLQNGYNAARNEGSFFGSVRWKPTDRLGLALNLREECYDQNFIKPIPTVLVDFRLSDWLRASGSVARNYHYPTLNDLYYSPGGNPDLRPEEGVAFDCGVDMRIVRRAAKWEGKLTLFGSETRNRIIWCPTAKGFWTPTNLQRAKGGGIELGGGFECSLGGGCRLRVNALYSFTRSTNTTEGNSGYGSQLPYIPLHSASLTASAGWHGWTAGYKFQYHSERYTSLADGSLSAFTLPDYFMNDLSLSKKVVIWGIGATLRGEVNNLFGEEYQSILARPMPGRNYALSVEIDFGAKSKNAPQ